MKKQNRLMKTAIALWCIVAVGCKQSPVIQQSSGYATMTVSLRRKLYPIITRRVYEGKTGYRYLSASIRLYYKALRNGRRERKKGQVLFIIDQVPYQAALNTAIANVEAAKASVATAQLTYDSKQELYKTK